MCSLQCSTITALADKMARAFAAAEYYWAPSLAGTRQQNTPSLIFTKKITTLQKMLLTMYNLIDKSSWIQMELQPKKDEFFILWCFVGLIRVNYVKKQK